VTPARRRATRARPPRRRPQILRAAALTALIAVAACGGIAGGADRTAPPAAATAMEPTTPTTTPPPGAAPTETASVAPAPAPEPRPPVPASLAGLDEGQLSGLLGPPRFKRRDDPAQIWQYRNDVCAIDVFLYKTGKDGPFTVLHVETRGRDKKPVAHQDCLAALLKDRDKRHAG